VLVDFGSDSDADPAPLLQPASRVSATTRPIASRCREPYLVTRS